MTESTTWDALCQLRLSGQIPAKPVIVTTQENLPERLNGVGCMVVVHQAGQVMPIKLLDDLDVIFMFDTCGLMIHVERLAKAKGVKWRSARVFCKCAGITTILPMSCESWAAAIEWMEVGIETTDLQ